MPTQESEYIRIPKAEFEALCRLLEHCRWAKKENRITDAHVLNALDAVDALRKAVA